MVGDFAATIAGERFRTTVALVFLCRPRHADRRRELFSCRSMSIPKRGGPTIPLQAVRP